MNKRALAFTLAVGSALLSACGEPVSQNPAGLLPQAKADGGTGIQDLLYVSNGNGEVTVYRYWQHTLVSVLTSFKQPMGLCVDSKHNVYITDAAAQLIDEYAHGGTKPIKKFSDAPDSPYACAVDPTTGNLAVANNDGTSQQGNLAIWSAATGNRMTYIDTALGNVRGCAYDANGNLLVTNGRSSGYSHPTLFAWLPAGASKLIAINVPGSRPNSGWYDVNGIQWDGKYFVLDAGYPYRISLQHGQAYYVGYTQLAHIGNGPYFIYDNTPGQQGTQIVGGIDYDEGATVDYFHYPTGGDPIYELAHGIDKPFGVAVSYKLKK